MKTKALILSIFMVALFTIPVFATESKLSESQSAKITTSCSTIRQSLKNLQRTDAHARTYFGAIYETVFTKYLKPLNLRLVRNDLSSSTLLEVQTSIATARTDFSNDFIDYSKSLEELIAIDCRLEPETFYQKLLTVREKRARVASDIKTLNRFLTSTVKSVEELKESLK